MIMGLNESISQTAPGLGILLGGVIAAITNPRVALAVAAAGSLVYAVAAWIVLRPSAIGERPSRRTRGRRGSPLAPVGGT